MGLTPTKAWPFHAWDSARAFAFNLNQAGPGSALVVYSEKTGWSPTIAFEKPVPEALAKKAVTRIGKTKGEMRVSKCPYPRHAIVLFSGDVPVASINVCFECGDILIWPPYGRASNWQAKKDKMYRKLMPVYDRVFPEWTALFEKNLGMPTDWKQLQND